ncbi:acyl carrier protein [Neptunicella sp. SCSIO 80796]|uniref:acyl carrier protein n=1 Tax=Neptunicella plasticusilytica TaxID=3117012 RepID=UPI003A4D72BF
MKTKNEIFNQLKNILVNEFELPEEDVTLQANLYQELDMDSIDAVDLVVKLRELTGCKIEPDAFKQVRTVEHVVDEIYLLLEG